MEAQQIAQLTGWKAAVAEVMAIAAMMANPMGMAVLLNLFVVNAIEFWDHLLPKWLLKDDTKDVSLGMAATLAILFQPVFFALICLGANWPVRGEMFLQGLVGGVIGSIVGAVAAYFGFSLDAVAERVKAKREAAPK